MEATFDIAEDELQIFLAEANEHLQVLDEGLVRLERAGDDPSLLQALFRAAHTLKGSAGVIGHRRMADLTHAMETVLDGVRKGASVPDAAMTDTLLESLDALRLLLNEVVDRQPAGVAVPVLVARLTRFTQPALPLAAPALPAAAPPRNGQNHAAPVRVRRASAASKAGPGRRTSGSKNGAGGRKAAARRNDAVRKRSANRSAPPPAIAVRADFSPECFASAARAFQVMLALHGLGEIVSMTPDQAALETSAPVQRLEARVRTTHSVEAVRDALLAVPDIERLVVGDLAFDAAAVQPSVAAGGAAAGPADESAQRLGDFLVSNGYLSAAQLQAAVEFQATEALPRHMLGQILVRLGYLTQAALDRAIALQIAQLKTALQSSQPAADRPRGRAEQTVRTSVERLDSLMNLVGELITGRNRLYQLHRHFDQRWKGEQLVDELSETALHLGRLTDQLQEEVMRIRMLPVSNLFNKFPRLVRDLARQTGKLVELVVKGEDTELDRSVIEAIGDPLIHMLRNAVDHGLETPDERRAAGKPERGTVRLTARHEEGRILITVEDDGRGIDLERVKASAVRKGLISEADAAALTTLQAVDLIFAPGLSTAQSVSGLSGRGVGMDIVRSNIERLNGSIAVETRPGQGAKFQIALPLTLAIISALLVQVDPPRAGQPAPVLAIPLSSVMEALHVAARDIHTVNGRPVTLLRGSALPLLRLGEAVGFSPGVEAGAAAREYVVAVRWGQSALGLRVRRLVGEQEIVIKSLGSLFAEALGVAGAAILGDGQIALIVDVPGLFKLAGA